MSNILTMLSQCRSLLPINSIFPSNTVCDLDATIATSYTSGQLWKNIITSPADGAAQGDYDFNLGASNTATTDDPTHTGGAGNAAAYFAMDGGDYFSLAGTVTAFLNSLHKATSHSIILALNTNISISSKIALFSTTAATSSSNIGISYDTGYSALFADQRVLTTDVLISPGGISQGGANLLVVISYNSSANTITRWFNSATGSSYPITYTATALDRIGPAPAIGANGTGSKMPSGTKLYSFAMLNSVVTNSDVAKIIKFYNARHKRVYA